MADLKDLPVSNGPVQQDGLNAHLLAIIQAQTEIAQATRDRQKLMQLVVQHARSLTKADVAAVGTVDGEHLAFHTISGRTQLMKLPIQGSLSGECLVTGKVVVSADTELDPRVDRDSTRAVNARSMAVAPLTDAQGRVGVLTVSSRRPNAFGEREAQTLQLMSGMLGAALGYARAFEERSRAEAESRAIAEQLSAVLASATEYAILGVDMHGSITFFSLGAERMLGYRADEVTGRRPDMFHDREEVRLAIENAGGSVMEAFLGRALHGEAQTREWTFIRKDGSRLSVALTLTPKYDSSGTLTGFIGVAQDITARKAIDRMKDEFISIVSHEMRTPLTGIRAALGLLAGGLLGDVPTKGQRMLEIALGNTERLARLVSDMLDLERMQSGEATLHLGQCDVHDVIVTSIDAVKSLAERDHIAITVIGEPSLEITADRERLVRALTHLLDNAVKFSAANTTIQVETHVVGDDLVRIGVRDQGRGIPDDQLERVFERFRQVDASDARAKGGTGVGLAICRMIVEQHAGRIWAENSRPNGTVVWIELPRCGPRAG